MWPYKPGIDFLRESHIQKGLKEKTVAGLTAWGLPARATSCAWSPQWKGKIVLHQRERRMASLLIEHGLTVRPVSATILLPLVKPFSTMHKNSFAGLPPNQQQLFHYWYEALENHMRAQQLEAKAAEKLRTAQRVCQATGFIPDEYLAYYLQGLAEIAG